MYVVVRKEFIHRLQVFPKVLVDALTLDLLVSAPYASHSVPYAIVIRLSTKALPTFSKPLSPDDLSRVWPLQTRPSLESRPTAQPSVERILLVLLTSQTSRNAKLAVQRMADLQQLA